MKVDTPIIPLAEAAYLLRSQLGPIRSWADFLADNIRGKQSIAGHTLLPCARKRDAKNLRPVYSVQDVRDFITKVLIAVPSAGKAPVKPEILTIEDSRLWRLNKFDKDGTPITLH